MTVLVATFLAADALAQEGSEAYATCTACHMADGVGIPGAFPPIRDRVAKIAALDGGRDYLIAVVTYGLMGAIEVEGAQYFGIMAGNSGTHDAADVAAVLNYVVFELGDGKSAGVEPFTAEEVEKAQAAVELKSPAGGGQIREKLVSEHGAQWP
jgi:mono/diheme cytochrome c family protein